MVLWITACAYARTASELYPNAPRATCELTLLPPWQPSGGGLRLGEDARGQARGTDIGADASGCSHRFARALLPEAVMHCVRGIRQ